MLRHPGTPSNFFPIFPERKRRGNTEIPKTERPRLAQLRVAGHSPRPFGAARALSFRAKRGICFFFSDSGLTRDTEHGNTDHAAFAAALSNFSAISPNEKERGTAKKRNYYGPLATHSTLPGHSDHRTRNTRARTTVHAAFAPGPTSAEAPDTPAICLWRCPPV
jgi:hypothetical protein